MHMLSEQTSHVDYRSLCGVENRSAMVYCETCSLWISLTMCSKVIHQTVN